MSFTLWISFVATVAVLAFTPGPSVLLVTAVSLNHRLKKTMGTILGDLSANLLQITLASLGLASIIIGSGEMFYLIKWLGAAYLVIMGLKKILIKPPVNIISKGTPMRKNRSFYLEGFLMSASNPKAIVFFAALFPLFIKEDLPMMPQITVLALTFLAIDGISLWTYAHFAGKLKSYLENSEKMHWQNRIVGGLLILSGLMLSLVNKSR